ncbi:hypothetical protein A3K80_07690 [Candidatus Bathyarchaeota archaeon RBG_13_38_9]|jgi:hypothetical protein|nr:MAG: hypothetical protein A3K80_07690 [Candidatus Bathyarchaeota archaeon RBG_13_38_9]
MKLFKKRREDDVFLGGEPPKYADRKAWHMRARAFMAATLVLIIIFDWYIIHQMLYGDPSLWYWVYSILLTIHIAWIMVAIAVLSP